MAGYRDEFTTDIYVNVEQAKAVKVLFSLKNENNSPLYRDLKQATAIFAA